MNVVAPGDELPSDAGYPAIHLGAKRVRALSRQRRERKADSKREPDDPNGEACHGHRRLRATEGGNAGESHNSAPCR